jgi:uncharacterized protein
MTPEEKNLLSDFLNRLATAGAVQADAEAAMMIAKTAEQQPSALYLTVQRAVWLEQALKHAEERIKTLEAEKQQAGIPATTSGNPWLSNTWGSGADNGRVAIPPSRMASNAPMGSGPAYGNPATMAPPPAYGANPGFMGGGSFMGGGGSFLANVAATAAGVAVGEMVVDAFTHHSDNRAESDIPHEHHHHPAQTDVNYTPVDDYDNSDSGGFDGGTDV